MKLEKSYSKWKEGKMSDKSFIVKANPLLESLWKVINETLESYYVLVNLFNGNYFKAYEKEILNEQPEEK